jgi:hypothetical protein
VVAGSRGRGREGRRKRAREEKEVKKFHTVLEQSVPWWVMN